MKHTNKVNDMNIDIGENQFVYTILANPFKHYIANLK